MNDKNNHEPKDGTCETDQSASNRVVEGVGPARAVERIIRPIRRRGDWPREAPVEDVEAGPTRLICVLDTETTGLSTERHQIIEICIAQVVVNEMGRIVAVPGMGSGLEDPGHPLSKEIVSLTGLTNADLAGQSIDRERLAAAIGECDGVVAFNSSFDRPFVEKLLPDLRKMPWGCAMKDVDWRAAGFERGPQNYLLMQTGYFNPFAHRAKDDVLSLIQLLDHVCDDGTSAMGKVLTTMSRPAWRFEACGAKFETKDVLREQRYRWASASSQRVWHKHVPYGSFMAEYRWYRETIGQRPVVVPLPATERYRAEDSWTRTPGVVNRRALRGKPAPVF